MQVTENVRGRSATNAVGVFEVEPTGHRLQYVRHLHDATPGGCVVLVPGEATRAPEFAVHLGPAATAVVPVEGDDRGRLLAGAVAEAMRRGLQRLVIPDADHFVLPLLRLLLAGRLTGRACPIEFRLLLMRTSTPGGSEPFTPAMIVKPAAVSLIRRFRQVRVAFLTDAWGVVTVRRGFGGVRGVRDPVRQASDVPSGRPLWLPPPDAGRVVVGLLGVIEHRKNLPLLIRAARADDRLVVVVGGRLSPEVAAQLAADDDAAVLREEGRLIVADRLLPPAEFAAVIRSVDVVVVLHDNDAPSGILAEACLRHTPVVVPAGAWLAAVVRETGIGRATALDPVSVGAAIHAAHCARTDHVEAARRASAVLGTTDFTGCMLR